MTPGKKVRSSDHAGGILHTLGGRLFLWLVGILVPALAAYAWLNVEATSEQWRQALYRGATRTSDVIKRSVHHSMLLNRMEDVRAIMKMIGEGQGVAGIRIYDKKGTIIVSGREEEVGRQVDLQAEACVVCHDRAKPLQSIPSENTVRVYRGANGERIFGLIDPIENAPECSNSGCHAHPPEQTVLGVLDVQMSMAYADERLAATVRQMILATVLLFVLVVGVSGLFLHRMVRVPVKRLTEGTERIARGDLETRLPEEGHDEVGQLARAFNRMTADLERARHELTGWSRRLEEKVVEKTEELGRIQRQVVHMEKMASLGKLAATVAHELNNPLAGVITYARLVERDLESETLSPAEREEALRYLRFIRKETGRCGDIVKNLLLFARPSGAAFAAHHLNPIVERALMLVRHHLEMGNVTLETRPLEGDDQLVCDADQLQQALVAMLVNAVQAMPQGGVLSVLPEADGEGVRLVIRDTGVGIPAAALPQIFEPFFSTKEGQNALGLGLSVVYGIVQRHGGRIDVESEEGKGTTFRVWLPRQPAPAVSSPAPRMEVPVR